MQRHFKKLVSIKILYFMECQKQKKTIFYHYVSPLSLGIMYLSFCCFYFYYVVSFYHFVMIFPNSSSHLSLCDMYFYFVIWYYQNVRSISIVCFLLTILVIIHYFFFLLQRTFLFHAITLLSRCASVFVPCALAYEMIIL